MQRFKTYRLYFFFFILTSFLGFSQTLSSNLDKTTLALGEVAIFKIQILDLNGKEVQIAARNELLPFHFEMVNDSIAVQKEIYLRSVKFAVFQEGKFTIPEIEVKVGDKILKTIPYEVEVINTAKKGDQINDIMKNKEVRLDAKDYWELYKFYILLALLIIAIIVLIIGIVKYGRKRKSSPAVTTNQTLKDLEKLKKKNYIENENFRAFYVELIEISRAFITKQYQIPADVLLTDDLITYMKSTNSISQENEKIVEDIFLRGDLVKFAKTIPNQEIMSNDFNEIRNFVKRSTKDVEAENLRTMQ
ncbi:BatD family protein [Epilithonimonas sp. JDS]|uniref:BatD family protein n=1 Tax=Epilithonimonas sp. JDS TaxID=2902797 RepID=UPI001E5BCAC1|nr:BatD family protein [Epilithonimonas sp. JDS]MCD9853089.1 BatD family protein [Epilithonimonas sp. JDS]